METTSESSGEETRRVGGGGRTTAVPRILLLAVLGIAGAVAVTAYAMTGRPVTAEAALASGHFGTAHMILSKAAEQGDAKAQNALGNLYYLGLGVARNDKLASQWYLKAALQANSDAQVNVARHYRLGHGLPRDEIRAYAWLVQARGNNNEAAEVQMKLLASGMELAPNQMQRAKQLYRKLEDLRPKERQDGDE